jgi:LysM repeat protein
MKIKTLTLIGLAGLMLSACASSNMSTESNSVKLYKVVEGDFLQAIASEEYDCETDWVKLYEANKDSIDNPNLIYPDQVLRIPVAEVEAGEVVEAAEECDEQYPIDKSAKFPENPWDFNVSKK